MRQTIFILTIAFGLWSCSNQATEKIGNINSVDTILNASNDKQQEKIYIKNSSQYDQKFIEGLSEYNEQLKLVNNYILIGQDTVYFPEEIQLPRTLTQAAERLKNSKAARDLFGATFVEHYAYTREWEDQQQRRAITDWQLNRYFEII